MVDGQLFFTNNIPWKNVGPRENRALKNLLRQNRSETWDVTCRTYEDIAISEIAKVAKNESFLHPQSLPVRRKLKRSAKNKYGIPLVNRFIPVFIIRSPYNLLASYIRLFCDKKHQMSLEKAAEHVRTLWLEYKREMSSREIAPKAVWIDYDRWFSLESYRRKIAGDLGLDFNDHGLERVSSIGSGSSFDGVSYDNHAQNMKVQERWKLMLKRPGYKEAFTDEWTDLAGPPPWSQT